LILSEKANLHKRRNGKTTVLTLKINTMNGDF